MSAEAATEGWRILIVDDEPDVHNITKLSLKHREWRKRPFLTTSAFSAAEAREIIEKDPTRFQAAIVDVVMESNTAGLELCQYMRANCPTSLRIILRTGQPGTAPEERVLNEYDIDYYLEKGDATLERLYAVVRACLRSSQDISTLVAFGKQLQSFSRVLQEVSTLPDLLLFMGEGLRFLELKYLAKCIFIYDVNANADASITHPELAALHEPVRKLGGQLRDSKREANRPIVGREFGLPEMSWVMPFTIQLDDDHGDGTHSRSDVSGILFVQFDPRHFVEKNTGDLFTDALLFIDNWKIAFSTLRLQERLARERMLRERMYFERLQSMATMVSGVAHEMNTPLGVANTASSTIVSLSKMLSDKAAGGGADIVDDLKLSCDLLTKNIQRAQTLIRSFKQLSASQLSDHRGDYDLVSILRDCTEALSPELKKHKVEVRLPDGERMPWVGYPGHLSQVIINFIQNTLRYAYTDQNNKGVDIRIGPGKLGADSYRIEFQDYGKGVPAEILPRMFEPFVTSGRTKGGTGLGLAISLNIVENLLKGKLTCRSKVDEGTTMIIDIPKVVPAVQEAGPPLVQFGGRSGGA